MEFRTEGAPAPGALVLVHGFLNTWSDELGIEDFGSPKAMEVWLSKANLWQGSHPLSAEDYRRLCEFRGQLRKLLQGQGALEELARSLDHLTFRLGVNEGQLMLHSAMTSAYDLTVGRLMAIIYASQIDGTWARLKCCALPSCGWAYYDSTRSRTKRWCSMKSCGSRHKAREYYRRQRLGT